MSPRPGWTGAAALSRTGKPVREDPNDLRRPPKHGHGGKPKPPDGDSMTGITPGRRDDLKDRTLDVFGGAFGSTSVGAQAKGNRMARRNRTSARTIAPSSWMIGGSGDGSPDGPGNVPGSLDGETPAQIPGGGKPIRTPTRIETHGPSGGTMNPGPTGASAPEASGVDVSIDTSTIILLAGLGLLAFKFL